MSDEVPPCGQVTLVFPTICYEASRALHNKSYFIKLKQMIVVILHAIIFKNVGADENNAICSTHFVCHQVN